MASLIKSIALKNFKGFSEEVRIDLRPITLLFGANSAGKSTILQALQYVREILERNNPNPDRTLQGGEAVDLGGFLNLVHGRDPQRKIEIQIAMALGDESIPEIIENAFEDWQCEDAQISEYHHLLQQIRRKVQSVGVRLVVGWSEMRERAVITAYEITTNEVWCVRITASEDGRNAGMEVNDENPIFLYLDMEKAVPYYRRMVGRHRAPASSEADEHAWEEPPEAQSYLGHIFNVMLETGVEEPGAGMEAWLNSFDGALPRVGQMLSIPESGVTTIAGMYIVREFSAFLSWLVVGPAMLLRNQLQAARYLGPLRRIPPRGFNVSLTKSDAAWSDGIAAWEALLSGSQEMLERCSHWMQDADRLDSGYGLVRTQVQEIDYNTGAPLGRPKPRIALVDQAGLTHQALDVGVGISQVLPVVVAAQDERASIVSIEQPELHVHPAVQVGLGDLFIDGAIERGLSFLLETHSEHLILRLLRRIREAAEEGNTEHINPDLLGVYYLANENGHITATRLPVNAEGDFDTPWPKGFFEERGPELF